MVMHQTELPTLLGEELTSQSCSCRVTQLLPGKKSMDLWIAKSVNILENLHKQIITLVL
jgi:hypothetical protein